MILIVDFGSQTAHLIGRRLRQIGAKIEYTNPEDTLSAIKQFKPNGIILSGGPSSVYEKGSPTVDKAVFEQRIPVLGICYGWQLMAHLMGGKVKLTSKEYGPETIHIQKPKGVLENLPKKE